MSNELLGHLITGVLTTLVGIPVTLIVVRQKDRHDHRRWRESALKERSAAYQDALQGLLASLAAMKPATVPDEFYGAYARAAACIPMPSLVRGVRDAVTLGDTFRVRIALDQLTEAVHEEVERLEADAYRRSRSWRRGRDRQLDHQMDLMKAGFKK